MYNREGLSGLETRFLKICIYSSASYGFIYSFRYFIMIISPGRQGSRPTAPDSGQGEVQMAQWIVPGLLSELSSLSTSTQHTCKFPECPQTFITTITIFVHLSFHSVVLTMRCGVCRRDFCSWQCEKYVHRYSCVHIF